MIFSDREAVVHVAPKKTAKKPRSLAYYPALDGMRAVAVGLVLFHHYFSQKVAVPMRLGGLGVDIFFVLSGFLITNILLFYKEKKTLGQSLKTFYIRRVLRIFPVYYFYLSILTIFFWNSLDKTGLLWAFGYSVNLYAASGHLPDLVYGHFWSLAVEEQFYLLWPFIILLTPRRFVKQVIICSIIGSFLFSLITGAVLNMHYTAWLHTFSCIQALGLGALLAVLKTEKSTYLNFFRKNNQRLILASLALFAFSVWTMQKIDITALVRLFGSSVSFLLILHLTNDTVPDDRLTRSMKTGFMRFIGRISYGIYVYHVLVQQVLDRPLARTVFKANPEDSFAVKFMKDHSYLFTMPLFMAITIGIAYVSFKLIEMPFNRLKR